MKLLRNYTLDNWEALLDKGPVRLKNVVGTVTVSKLDGRYRWHAGMPFGLWTILERDTLAELFLEALFQSMSFANPQTVDADSEFVAMLPGGDS